VTRLFAKGEPCQSGFAWRGAGARGSIGDGAGDETRTRDINLGKVALYQLSYTRACEARKIAARPGRSMREFALGDAPHTSDTMIETAQNFPK
jgi:hypothetical protein